MPLSATLNFSFTWNQSLKTKMVLISLVDSQIDDLSFLLKQPAQITADFCKLAWSFLGKGTNKKLYQVASQKLQVDIKQIQSGVKGLANIFIEAGKNALNENELRETLTSIGFSEESGTIICTEYMSQKHLLEDILAQTGIQHPQFKGLEWRFETQVSSRSLRNQVQPRVLMKLELENRGKAQNFCVQSDIPNVIHMNQVINRALQESQTQHAKRIQRAVT